MVGKRLSAKRALKKLERSSSPPTKNIPLDLNKKTIANKVGKFNQVQIALFSQFL